ncbi:helix-turn-helix domain-containing protein [Pontibacter roseus]|uniref:helix-turn-helix domain-containing protein n=1 Tax=Pontibacter roseus TaxID=336989 RepID=UPI000524C325|nr:helix-turn-helix domain-containing protein [Pontibacter roseus]
MAYEELFHLRTLDGHASTRPLELKYYNIFLLEGSGTISVDFVEYAFQGRVALFTSPYQHILLNGTPDLRIEQLSFHGDFYCIEYHKQEVACNGLLFNNIYKQPFIPLHDGELHTIFNRIRSEIKQNQPFSEPILRTYLQLILAFSSRTKLQMQSLKVAEAPSGIEQFKELLEKHFLNNRTIDFYATELALSPTTFAKRCKSYFGKSPSQLIQERVVLEAKKELHLTRKSVKEVAAALRFEDEHYFSRFFKKHTGVSPTVFREKVGISIVADSSMR